MYSAKGNCDSENEQKNLLELIKEAQKYPNRSRQYRKLFNKILLAVQNSCRLYRAKDILRDQSSDEYEDIYGDALQRTFIYMNRNLIKYDETRSRFMTWVNTHLKWRVQDVLRERRREYPPNRSYTIHLHDEQGDPLISAPDKATSPQEQLEAQQLQEWLRHKIEENREELHRIYIRKRPDINAYNLFVFLIPLWDKTDVPLPTLKELADEITIENKRLRRFYRERCLHHLKSYVKEYEQGSLRRPQRLADNQ